MSLNRKYDIPSVVDTKERALNSLHSCFSRCEWCVYDSQGNSLFIDDTLHEKLLKMRSLCDYDVSFSFVDPERKRIGFYYRFCFYFRGELLFATLESYYFAAYFGSYDPIFSPEDLNNE